MIFIIFLLFIQTSQSWGATETKQIWHSVDRINYFSSHFTELEHELTLRGEKKLVKILQKQEIDLAGCRALHGGTGGTGSLIQCMRFINREQTIGLVSKNRAELLEDI